MKTLTLTTILALAALTGCAEQTDGFRPSYDFCNDTSECSELAELCTQLVVEQINSANETYTAQNMLCTRGCATDLDCPQSFNGQAGQCIVGLGTDVGTCYESCLNDGDCIDDVGEDNWTCSQVEGTTQAVCVPF